MSYAAIAEALSVELDAELDTFLDELEQRSLGPWVAERLESILPNFEEVLRSLRDGLDTLSEMTRQERLALELLREQLTSSLYGCGHLRARLKVEPVGLWVAVELGRLAARAQDAQRHTAKILEYSGAPPDGPASSHPPA
jgi:hypothetical protein